MFKYYSFDEIDPHKWDSSIHYSPNGNIFAYHWYLKGVWREFGAIIEGDYESLMPLPPQRLRTKDLSLVPELGPYSINRINKKKVNTFLRMANEHSEYTLYPINSRIDKQYINRKEKLPFHTLHMIDSYDRILERYSKEAKQAIADVPQEPISITSGIKPEVLIEHSTHTDDYNNALLRVMYQALHKGIGWSSAIKSKEGDRFLAMSFFVSSHNSVQEIFTYTKGDPKYRYVLFDLLIRQNAGKPTRIASSVDGQSLENVAFENEAIDLLNVGMTSMDKIKKWFTSRK